MSQPHEFRSHQVFTRERWADDWQLRDNLYCDQCTFASSGEMGSAVFRWTFGSTLSRESTAFGVRAPQDFTGLYVKVEIAQEDEANPKRWYGLFLKDSRSYGGEGGSTPAHGRQVLTAVGLEYLLERKILDSSFAEINDGGTVEEVEIERALPFNPAGGYRESRRFEPNMNPDGEQGPVFIENPAVDAFEWTGDDILDYLVGYHMPKDLDDVDHFTWSRAEDGGILGAFQGTLDSLHGQSLRVVLTRLMDRRRLLAWYLRVNVEAGAESGLEIVPFNFNHEDLDLPGGVTVSANANQTAIEDLGDEARVKKLEVVRDGSLSFARVIARGERVVVCGTMYQADSTHGVSPDERTWDKDWTSDLELDYESACIGAYTGTDDIAKANENQEFRQQDQFRSVYSRFLVKPEKVANWLDTTEQVNQKDLRLYPPQARFLSVLPLRDDLDYTTPSTTIGGSVLPQGSREEYVAPLAFVKVGTRWHMLDQISAGDDAELAASSGGRHWSASLHMRHEALGFVLHVSGGPQHLLAKTDFSPLGGTFDTEIWDAIKPAAVDWQDVGVTVAIETDNWAEAQWPDTPEDEGDTLLDLILSFPGKRMEYVLEGTVFAIDTDGTLKTASAGGWIVDDSETLRDLARLAYEWYRQPRKSVVLTVRSLDCPYELGQLITKIQRPGAVTPLEEVNSVVTRITYDLLAGTYTIYTQFAELDLRTLTPSL